MCFGFVGFFSPSTEMAFILCKRRIVSQLMKMKGQKCCGLKPRVYIHRSDISPVHPIALFNLGVEAINGILWPNPGVC